MKAKILVYALPALILTTIQLAEAQQTKKIPQIGFLSSAAPSGTPYESFRQGLRDLGYVEGQNTPLNIDMEKADPGWPSWQPNLFS